MCGGTIRSSFVAIPGSGLSPRVRGNLTCSGQCHQRCGSIPACAGEPLRREAHFGDEGVYPRVCGGTHALRRGLVHITGLSPRVRGNQPRSLMISVRQRSIPACAGEPSPAVAAGGGRTVYPRVCGGTPGFADILILHPGLSPRVRGNLVKGHLPERQWGSIPACAGEPTRRSCLRRPCRVYPRVCGGTPSASRWSPAGPGLSPRVRGNHGADVRRATARGSIPACAGEPRAACVYASRTWVYPRVCGGTGGGP